MHARRRKRKRRRERKRRDRRNGDPQAIYPQICKRYMDFGFCDLMNCHMFHPCASVVGELEFLFGWELVDRGASAAGEWVFS